MSMMTCIHLCYICWTVSCSYITRPKVKVWQVSKLRIGTSQCLSILPLKLVTSTSSHRREVRYLACLGGLLVLKKVRRDDPLFCTNYLLEPPNTDPTKMDVLGTYPPFLVSLVFMVWCGVVWWCVVCVVWRVTLPSPFPGIV